MANETKKGPAAMARRSQQFISSLKNVEAEKAAGAREKHLRTLCVCGTPFGMHTPEMTYLCAMNRS